jgi:hypothetical protein
MNENQKIISSAETTPNWAFHTPPKPVGYWQITPKVDGCWHTQFAVYARLDPKHIKNTEELLGWTWIEAKENE